MKVTELVARLDCSRATGQGRWIARCPAHEDRSPSLSVREGEAGIILVHCFAGCDVRAVVSAVGLELADLFPDCIPNTGKQQRRASFDVRDALACVAFEALVVLTTARMLVAGETIPSDHTERLSKAVQRITAALDVARA